MVSCELIVLVELSLGKWSLFLQHDRRKRARSALCKRTCEETGMTYVCFNAQVHNGNKVSHLLALLHLSSAMIYVYL